MGFVVSTLEWGSSRTRRRKKQLGQSQIGGGRVLEKAVGLQLRIWLTEMASGGGKVRSLSLSCGGLKKSSREPKRKGGPWSDG